jgi:hypothetical protein
MFDGFAPSEVRGAPAARQEWAVEQIKMAAQASRRLGLTALASFPAPWRGLTSTLGRGGPRAWSRRLSTNWPGAGSPS